MSTKKDVIEVLKGFGSDSIIYNGITFKYSANNVTIKEAKEYIASKLENNRIQKFHDSESI